MAFSTFSLIWLFRLLAQHSTYRGGGGNNKLVTQESVNLMNIKYLNYSPRLRSSFCVMKEV